MLNLLFWDLVLHSTSGLSCLGCCVMTDLLFLVAGLSWDAGPLFIPLLMDCARMISVPKFMCTRNCQRDLISE